MQFQLLATCISLRLTQTLWVSMRRICVGSRRFPKARCIRTRLVHLPSTLSLSQKELREGESNCKLVKKLPRLRRRVCDLQPKRHRPFFEFKMRIKQTVVFFIPSGDDECHPRFLPSIYFIRHNRKTSQRGLTPQ